MGFTGRKYATLTTAILLFFEKNEKKKTVYLAIIPLDQVRN